MSKKCRILLFFVVIALAIGAIACVIYAINKPKDKIVYAETISFTTGISGINLYIENELIIDKSCVKITPSNCVLEPEFTIKKSGTSEERVITDNKISFDSIGKYVLTCKVKSSEHNYVNSKITITVVENSTENIGMYVKPLNVKPIYVEDVVELSAFIQMTYPTNSIVDVKCSEHISYINGKITAIKDGVGTIDISLTYDHITIFETISIVVKPKIVKSDIDLILSVDNVVTQDNVLQLTYSPFNFAINYTLTKLDDNQEINCWTNSNAIQIVRYNTPTIELKMLTTGNAIIYVSPTMYPDIIFEINVTIV